MVTPFSVAQAGELTCVINTFKSINEESDLEMPGGFQITRLEHLES